MRHFIGGDEIDSFRSRNCCKRKFFEAPVVAVTSAECRKRLFWGQTRRNRTELSVSTSAFFVFNIITCASSPVKRKFKAANALHAKDSLLPYSARLQDDIMPS